VAPAPDIAGALLLEFQKQGLEFPRYVSALMRVLPSVLIIPAFGLSAVALPIRLTLGAALAFSVAPALSANVSGVGPLAYALEFARGLPVALSASAVLWASSMTGALADELRGNTGSLRSIGLESSTPLGTLLSLMVALVFLVSGGPERLVRALSHENLVFSPLVAVHDLVAGLGLAVAVAAPLVVVSVVVDVGVALASRVAFPVPLQQVLSPLKPFVLLCVVALLLERMLELFALALRSS